MQTHWEGKGVLLRMTGVVGNAVPCMPRRNESERYITREAEGAIHSWYNTQNHSKQRSFSSHCFLLVCKPVYLLGIESLSTKMVQEFINS